MKVPALSTKLLPFLEARTYAVWLGHKLLYIMNVCCSLKNLMN